MSSAKYELNTIFGAIGPRTFGAISLLMWLLGDAFGIRCFFPLFGLLWAVGRLIVSTYYIEGRHSVIF